MSTFVEECRTEWRRLGVPDVLVRVPRLVGLDGCSVKQVAGKPALRLRKWTPYGMDDLPKSSMCKNIVLAQQPAAGQVVERPVTVTVRMSKLRS